MNAYGAQFDDLDKEWTLLTTVRSNHFTVRVGEDVIHDLKQFPTAPEIAIIEHYDKLCWQLIRFQ